jgi:hypothetical protein
VTVKLRLIASLAGFFILITSAARAQLQNDPAPDQEQTESVQAEPEQTEPMQSEPDQAQPAQTESAQTQSAPKGTGVARVSLIHGDVSTQRGDSGDWATAVLNAPIVSGDRVSTGDNSRTELQLDYANILRIDERTQANITGLDRTQIQIQLARGLANYSVLKDSEADVEIDAPNLSVHPRRGDGSYRITVYSDDQAEVLVRRGEADISTPQGSTHVVSGQSIMVRGSGNDTQYKLADARARDDFDRWNSDRDNTIRNAQSWSRTNRYYVGSEDLDTYGRWRDVPDYGQVWQPAAASDWAPYRDGRWVWEPYWGWTWVSYEPWGWAPYHYGRWFMYQNSWVWWPGQSYGYRHYRPVWAPAYVSFFGFGSGIGFGASFGFGSVGWLPIGPCDGFYPWWGGYRSRFNVVNIYNVHNVYNYNYRNGGIPPLRRGTTYSNVRLASFNDRVRRGISTVGANEFGRGRFRAQPVSSQMFRNGRLVAGNLPVVPNRESLLAGQRRAVPPTVGRGSQPERFFSNNRNRQVQTPRSFDREAADVRSSIQRDGRFTPIVGNQRSNAGDGNARSLTQGRNGQNLGFSKPSAGLPADRSNQGSSQGQGANQTWRRLGPPVQRPNGSGAGTGLSNPSQRGQVGSGNPDWRRSPNAGTPRGSVGNGSVNNSNPAGRVNTPVDRPGSSSTPRGNNQDWRRLDRPSSPAQRGPASGGSVNNSNPAGRMNAPVDRPGSSSTPLGNNQDWRRLDRPSSPAQRGPTGGGSVNNSNPAGRMNAPVDRPGSNSTPRGNNQDWRRLDRPSSPAQRNSGGMTEAPASRDRSQRGGSVPTQDRGSDWRRPPAQRPTDSPVNRTQGQGQGNDSMNRFPSRNPAPQAQRDPGNWRQPAPRSNGPESRPQLDMRQPIVRPRPSSPPPSRGYSGNGGYSNPRSAPSGGAYSSPNRGGGGYSAPSGGGYSSPNRGGGGGGGYSAPSRGSGGGYSAPRGGGGGGYSAPRGGGGGGGQHSSGNNGPHRGR